VEQGSFFVVLMGLMTWMKFRFLDRVTMIVQEVVFVLLMGLMT
jgi:hypothetical protein